MKNSTNLVQISTKLVIANPIYGVYIASIALNEEERMQPDYYQVTEEVTQKNTEEAIQDATNACYNRVALTGQAHNIVKTDGNTNFQICVNRLSGATDTIPVTVPFLVDIYEGQNVTVVGPFSSYNKIIGNRSKLILHVIAQEVMESIDEDFQSPNTIDLTAFICKAPTYRTTPFNREIADLLLAVNSLDGRSQSSYIPAIAWGKNARYAKNLIVGEKVHINGRIQSREYQKRLEDGTTETRVAYEVSINNIYKEEMI